jgi:glycogen(starch) synthase
MRVMMLSWEYPPRIVGGISPHVQGLSHQLAKQGIEVHVVTKSTPHAPDEEDDNGVHVHRVHLAREPRNFVDEIALLNDATEISVRQLLEDWRPGGQPTIFHAHDWLSLDAARELKYEYSLPMIATVHATEEGRNQGIHNQLQKYIHEQEYWLTYEAWRVIVCTEYMRGEVERSFDVPGDKIEVIHNGVVAEKFGFNWSDWERNQWRRRYAADDEKIVLYVGRFVREKGIQVLLNAASAILAVEPKTRFIVVGGGHRKQFEEFVRWVGLRDRIHFTGFMAGRNLYQMYRVADVAVFPSLYEPFGIVALEAMAAGAPVVASDAGGLKEVVSHDITGTSHYAGDPGSLAWAVLRALQDPARAAQLNENARYRLQTDFNWENIATRTIDLYDRVWNEFLDSYWAEGTVWPVSPGAEDRARRRRLQEKLTETPTYRTQPEIEVEGVPSTFGHEEHPQEEADTIGAIDER